MAPMLDNFDCRLLDEAQRDADRTAEELAERVALSPSAIARRLRRLRSEGLLARTIAIVSPKLLERRLKALVLVQLNEHADRAGQQAVLQRLDETEEVACAWEVSGSAPVSRTWSWNSRMSNLSPSAAFALSRSCWIFIAPVLYAVA
jgi:DNA-binding Lrp family transcriptional regulator